MATILIFAAIGVPWVGATLVWFIGDKRPNWQHLAASIFSAIAAICSLLLLHSSNWGVTDSPLQILAVGPTIGSFSFVVDALSIYLAAIATVIGSLSVIFSVGYMSGSPQLGRYYVLVLLFIGSMCGLVFSGNLLFLFLFWEATAFCSYALIAFHNDDPKAVAAGMKALIITQFGGVGLLIGIILAAAYLPDLQISSFLAGANEIPSGVLAVVAFGFLLAAVAKSAQVPLYMWLPDAMEAPTPVSALIHAATMVNAGIYLLARFYPALVSVPYWTVSVVTVGLASVLLAAILATINFDLKRVLAYSTVSQLGYMITAVGIGALFESQLYLFSHAIFKALLFLGAGAVIHELGTRNMRMMGGLGRRMPWVAIPFLIGAAALVGLPFFNGFWSKELLLENAFHVAPIIVYIPLVFGAALTAFYSARMCRMVFFGEQRSDVVHEMSKVSPFMIVPLLILAAGVIVAWVFAEPFAHWMAQTMPFHAAFILPERTIDDLISTHTVFTISTGIVLCVTTVGLFLGWRAANTSMLDKPASPLARAAEQTGFIFDKSAAFVATLTHDVAAALQKTQTGVLNWNMAGIVLGVIALLILLMQGALR